jgi:hypothetical protein
MEIDMSQDKSRKQIIIGFFSIVATCVVVALIIAGAYRSRNSDNVINVTGSSQQVITSDVVTWNANFSRSVGPNGLKDGSAELKNDNQVVMDFLTKEGIAPSEIDFQPVSVSPNYDSTQDKNGNSSQVFTGYTLSQSFTIQSHELAKVASAIGNVGDLLNKGLVFQSSSPQYFYSKLGDLKVQMINNASKDALVRAKAVAENTGNHVGALRSASIGIIQITSENSTDLSGEGSYDTSSVKKQITVVVHAAFAIK